MGTTSGQIDPGVVFLSSPSLELPDIEHRRWSSEVNSRNRFGCLGSECLSDSAHSSGSTHAGGGNEGIALNLANFSSTTSVKALQIREMAALNRDSLEHCSLTNTRVQM